MIFNIEDENDSIELLYQCLDEGIPVYYCLKKTKKMNTHYYPTLKEKVEVMNKLGPAAAILYEYYYIVLNRRKFFINDSKTAEELNWTERTVKKWKYQLISSEFFYQEEEKLKSGLKHQLNIIGIEAVQEYKFRLANKKASLKSLIKKHP